MNEQNQSNDERNISNGAEDSEAVVAVKNADEAKHWVRLKGAPVLGLMVMLAVGLRLGMVDLPRVWAGWHKYSMTNPGWWDYPCQGCPCPPGSNEGGDDGSGGDSGSGGGGSDGSGGGGGGGAGGVVLGGRGNRNGGGAVGVGGTSGCSACGGSGSSAAGSGGGCEQTNTCPAGMPKWWVSEPLIDLWLKDIPLFYHPSHGSAVAFKLLFKNRPDDNLYTEMTTTTNIFSLGQSWFSPWRSYLKATGTPGNYVFFNGLGGDVTLTPGQLAYHQLMGIYTNSAAWGTNLLVQYTSGAQDVFGWKFTGSDGVDRYFLTKKVDPDGSTTTFDWEVDGSGVAYLSSITDVDGNATSLTYTNINGFTLLAQVSDAYGHTATLEYDQDPSAPVMPTLTNITDAAGLSSSLVYGSSGLTNLITPYGTNTFTVLGDMSTPAIHVNEMGKRDHLYVYIDGDSYGQQTTNYSEWVPDTSPFSNTFDTGDSDFRNSFHWGPRQYPLLPSDFLSNLTNSTPTLRLDLLYSTNYLDARQRHWLIGTSANGDDDSSSGQTLSFERAPSPDGETQGQITWYDYDGKTSADTEGTMMLPLFKAWLLPNGESRFVRTERNELGYRTRIIETYSDASGSVAVRTNLLGYATNEIDLLVVTNADGVLSSSNVFNEYHEVRTNCDALNQETVYTYNGNHQLTSVHTPAGLTTTNLYGTDNYLSKTIDLQIDRTNSYTWSNGLVYSHTDERGLSVTDTWDGLNRLIKVTYPDGSYVTNEYDKLDVVMRIDRMGFTNRYVYNDFRQVTQSIDALDRTNSYDYCDCGALDSMTDPLGNSTTYTYDLSGRLLTTAYPDEFGVTNQYDLMNRLTVVTDSAGSRTTNWFNNQGLVVAVSNTVGRVQTVVYDALDRPTNTVDANGVTLVTTYDDLNRLRTRTYPDTGVEEFGYSARGLVAYTNQLDKITRYAYDEAGRKTFETNANSEVTQYSYDAGGDLESLTDAKNQMTTWNYDEYGRVTNKVDAAATEILRYEYDAGNRLTNRWSKAKGNTVYAYDAVGNLTNVDYPVSPDIALQYDGRNQLTNMVDAVGTTVYGYDAAGQLLSENGPWDDDTVSYTYNNRLRSGLSLIQPNAAAWTESYTYDAAKRLTDLTSPAGSFSYTYDSTRKRLVGNLALPGGSYITNTYDSVARLLSTTLENSTNGVLNSHTYGYNVGNQRLAVTNTAGDFRTYTYDDIGQLKTAVGYESGGSSRLQEQLGYAYDDAHNLSYRTNNALVQTFEVNNLNELATNSRSGTLTVAGTTTSEATNVTVNDLTASLYNDNTFAKAGFSVADGNNTFTAVGQDSYGRVDTNTVSAYLPATAIYTYDDNGNLTSDGRRYFEYDDENQLTAVTVSNAWRSEFTYDGKMRRRIRKEFTWQAGGWVQTSEVHYIYDGNLVIQERDGNNLALVSYTRGKDLSGTLQGAGGIGGLLARTANQSSAFYHCDGNGNVTCLVGTNQLVVARYLYDPYGNTLSASGPLAEANLYRFSSKEWHQNSGLIYYLYRFYDPSLQRWVNRDPVQENGGTLNMFAFVANDPMMKADINGRLLGGLIDFAQNFLCSHISGSGCKLCCALTFQAALVTDGLEAGAIITSGVVIGPVTIGAGTAGGIALGLGDLAISHANDIKAFKDCVNGCKNRPKPPNSHCP